MAKVQIIAEITPNLPISEFNFYDLYRSTFEKSEFGRIKRLLSLKEMAENFGLISKSMKPKLGRKAFFNPFSEGARLKHCSTLHNRLF